MNQILVTEKLYVTPELRRKKKIYKFNFIISIAIIVAICFFYARSEYAKGREEEISDDIYSKLAEQEQKITAEEQEIAKQNEGVWKIIIASTREEEKKQEAQNQPNNTDISQIDGSKTKESVKKTKIITASNGKRYPSLGTISIPKIDVNLAILDKPKDDEEMVAWLKISPCKFYGVDPNEIGNCSIAGHNYRNKRFFSKVPNLVMGDKIKITDVTGTTITYSVKDKYTVDPEQTDCVYRKVPGKRMITLITCTDDGSQRVIVHAVED